MPEANCLFILPDDSQASGITNKFATLADILKTKFNIFWVFQSNILLPVIKPFKYEIIPNLKKRKLDRKDFCTLFTFIKKNNIDVVFISYSYLMKPLFFVKLLRPRTKVIFYVGSTRFGYKERLFSRWGNLIIVSSQEIVNNSLKIRRKLEKYIKFDPQKIFIFNTALFFLKKNTEVNSPSAFNDNIIRFGYLGRIDLKHKNNLMLINAVKILIDKGYKCHVKIMGDAPLSMNDYEVLKEEIKRLKLEPYVELIPASNAPEDKKKFFDGIDIFVITSYYEGGPNVFYEALSHNKLILTTRVGSIPDMEKKGFKFFYVKKNNAQDLAEKAEMLVKNKKLREEIFNNNLKILESFDIDNYKNLFVEKIWSLTV